MLFSSMRSTWMLKSCVEERGNALSYHHRARKLWLISVLGREPVREGVIAQGETGMVCLRWDGRAASSAKEYCCSRSCSTDFPYIKYGMLTRFALRRWDGVWTLAMYSLWRSKADFFPFSSNAVHHINWSSQFKTSNGFNYKSPV